MVLTHAGNLRATLAGLVDRFSYTALPADPASPQPSSSTLPTHILLKRLHDAVRSRFVRLLLFTALALCILGGIFYRNGPVQPSPVPNEDFIAAVLRSPVEGLLDPEPIQYMCAASKLQDGLVWHCDTVVGGIGNVGNMWLNCMRYAIEAGATAVILPRLGARATDLINLGSSDNSVDLSELFDVDYFLHAWARVCPQMHAYASEADFASQLKAASRHELLSSHLAQPAAVAQFEMHKYLLVNPTGWRAAFDGWLAEQVDVAAMSAATPVRVRQGMVLAQWNREAAINLVNGTAFGTAFPRLFQFPAATRRLAAVSLWHLAEALQRPVVADSVLHSEPELTNHLTSGRILGNAYMGVHMRVAADAAKVGWPGYEVQAPFFIAEAVRRNLSTVYLATGSDEHRSMFRHDAAAAGLTVFTKGDLLAGSDLMTLQKMTWDQQALVDFDVLMHSSFCYGFVRSSFSWALALRRGTLPEAGPSQVTPELGDEYRDELSAVVGRHENINPEGMWP
ncbi:alternative oxidase [Ophiostoma piceae UAMH 11346]|uniref:Alternative oxidase n=1 Tax=Ophiostoma piceae (strain UAMH 11346) TaxID=1262450 RepID=S3BTU2_OPHP1|nr:alternative oxidase [Ophiostoma piceae UAMH 11346]